MKFFLDTANLEEIRQGVSLGDIDGVTTNPTLVAKENRPFREHILEICKIVKDGIVNTEVVSTDAAGILREAREIASWHPNIVVKIPMIPEGVRALSTLSKEGLRINITLVFSATQALIVEAARMGAHIGTLPFKVFEQLFKHPLTDRGLEGFLKDWEKARVQLGDIFEPAAARKAIR